jgi:hypothetical protein
MMCSMGIWNSLNVTLNVMVHEWALDLNIGLKNLSFKIASSCIVMDFGCFETSFYVLTIHVIF